MRNPKTKAGLITLAVMLILGGLLASRMIPTIQEVQLEMSLTPTPIPEEPKSVMQVTLDPNAPTPEPILRTGSQGDQVVNLQSRLQTLGYYAGEIDGQFGPGTRDAVRTFQDQNGLVSDGIVGQETREILFSVSAKPYTEPEATETPGAEGDGAAE